jgi:hypothetical protein
MILPYVLSAFIMLSSFFLSIKELNYFTCHQKFSLEQARILTKMLHKKKEHSHVSQSCLGTLRGTRREKTLRLYKGRKKIHLFIGETIGDGLKQ